MSAQKTTKAEPPAGKKDASQQLQFRFERHPWRGVLDWLAEQADLALYVGDLPTGSFTYSDARQYTPDEAINRINLFLIPQRYSLVRSGKLLSVINLDDITSVRQLDAMAEVVDVESLEKRGTHELVKCLLPLGEIVPEQALEELSGLMLIRAPTVLRNTNQLAFIETAGKLRMVQRVLASMAKPESVVGPVKQFALGGLDAERALALIRPHVGLDPLAMTGADISLSLDDERQLILASGSTENLDAVASVLRTLQSAEVATKEIVNQQFLSHDVGGADIQTVVNVLQTLLADEDVRMSADVKANQIAIYAAAEVHDLVDKTILELAGKADAIEFRAIPVPSIDPRYAALVLNEMFGATEAASGSTNSAANDEALRGDDVPKISADPFSRRLFVRAKASKIAEIERAVREIGQPAVAQDARLRLLPYQGERAKQILKAVQEFWPHGDELMILPPGDTGAPRPLEFEINPESTSEPTPSSRRGVPRDPATTGQHTFTHTAWADSQRRPSVTHDAAVLIAQAEPVDSDLANSGQPSSAAGRPSPRAEAADKSRIRAQWTPRGILVYSDDADALRRFESHLQLIAGSGDEVNQRLAVFYLKHVTVDDANQLLRRLLDAEELSDPLAGIVAPPGGLLASLVNVTGTDGAGRMWTAGTTAVIPDRRLNRIFAYGTVADLTNIEMHLQVIDRESSIAQVKTFGAPRVIELRNVPAETVAAIIRDAYSGRIAATARERQQAAQQQNQNQQNRGSQSGDSQSRSQPGPTNQAGQSANSADNGQQPSMTVAVDAQSNSLIVTAPDQLASEVEALALSLDERGARTIGVLAIPRGSPTAIQATLRSLLGDQFRASRPGSQRETPSQSGASPSSRP